MEITFLVRPAPLKSFCTFLATPCQARPPPAGSPLFQLIRGPPPAPPDGFLATSLQPIPKHVQAVSVYLPTTSSSPLKP